MADPAKMTDETFFFSILKTILFIGSLHHPEKTEMLIQNDKNPFWNQPFPLYNRNIIHMSIRLKHSNI